MQNDRKFYVYVHRRKTDGSVFYVGKGKGNRYRKTQSRSEFWRRTANKYGWVHEIVCPNLTEHCAYSVEKILIASLPRLTNICEGGGGASGYKHSEASKLARSMRFRGPLNPMFGVSKKLTMDHKIKIGNSNRRPKPAGFGEKMSRILTGRSISEEQREVLRKAQKGKHVGENNSMYGATREKCPRFDPSEFTFLHNVYGEETMTTYDMERKFNLPKGGIRKVARGITKSCMGWRLKP